MTETRKEKLKDNSANDECLHDAMEQADPQQLVELADVQRARAVCVRER